jgi:hypothetical protein
VEDECIAIVIEKLDPGNFPHLGRQSARLIGLVLETFAKPGEQDLYIDPAGDIWEYSEGQINLLGNVDYLGRQWERLINSQRAALLIGEYEQAAALFKVFRVYWKRGDSQKPLTKIMRWAVESAKRFYPRHLGWKRELAANLIKKELQALKAA